MILLPAINKEGRAAGFAGSHDVNALEAMLDFPPKSPWLASFPSGIQRPIAVRPHETGAQASHKPY